MGDKAYRDRHNAKGLCQSCNREAAVHGYCLFHYWRKLVRQRLWYSRHREEKIKKVQERQRALIESGRCPVCGIELVEGEGWRCVNCATFRIRHAVRL